VRARQRVLLELFCCYYREQMHTGGYWLEHWREARPSLRNPDTPPPAGPGEPSLSSLSIFYLSPRTHSHHARVLALTFCMNSTKGKGGGPSFHLVGVPWLARKGSIV